MSADALTCPKCGGECERDMVDVGVGEIPAGPWGCPVCHWVEDTRTILCFDGEEYELFREDPPDAE